VRYRKTLLTSLLLTHPVFGLIKMSAILFYKRIFAIRRFNLVANGAFLLVLAWTIIAFFGFLFSAKGVSSYWTTQPQFENTEYNFNFTTFLTAMNSIDIVLDVLILCLPLPMVWDLQMTLGRKVVVSCLFLLGFFCVIASGMKLNYSIKIKNFYKTASSFGSPRGTYLDDTEALWASIECCASIIAACLPTLRPIFSLPMLEPIFNSFKSVFSFRSLSSSQKTTGSSYPEPRLIDPTVRNGSWHELKEPNSKSREGSASALA